MMLKKRLSCLFRKKRELMLSFCFSFVMLFKLIPLVAQDWAKTNITDLQRVDLRDLGYPMVNEIPENSSAITSLVTAHDGLIYGATTGDESWLFLFDPEINKVRHLGKIPGQESVHHSIVEDKQGYIYLGTGRNMFEEINLSKGGIGKEETFDKTLWDDIKNHFRDYQGGHLYRYFPEESNRKVKTEAMSCDLEDLGIPVASNSIYALTINQAGDEIYGLTYPDGHFFIYGIEAKKFTDIGIIDDKIVFHGPERFWRSLSRALICDNTGRVYFSSTNGSLRFYDPGTGKIESTGLTIPGDYYYLQFYEDYAVIDYLAKDKSGLIYGGTSDGYMFSFDPVKMKLLNLGKVRASRRLRCLTVGLNGKIYIMAGERSSSRPCQFYSFDPASGGYDDLGLLIVDRSPYYYWRGQQFDAMTTGKDGTIYIGESERRSHLFLFMP
jgi:hypothetical protein